MNTHSQYRLTYTALHHANGSPKVNVYADVSMLGLAPVLGNHMCLYFFLKHMQGLVGGLRLHNPKEYDARPLAIKTLKEMGFYGEPVPSGMKAKLGFYLAFMSKM